MRGIEILSAVKKGTFTVAPSVVVVHSDGRMTVHTAKTLCLIAGKGVVSFHVNSLNAIDSIELQ